MAASWSSPSKLNAPSRCLPRSPIGIASDGCCSSPVVACQHSSASTLCDYLRPCRRLVHHCVGRPAHCELSWPQDPLAYEIDWPLVVFKPHGLNTAASFSREIVPHLCLACSAHCYPEYLSSTSTMSTYQSISLASLSIIDGTFSPFSAFSNPAW